MPLKHSVQYKSYLEKQTFQSKVNVGYIYIMSLVTCTIASEID